GGVCFGRVLLLGPRGRHRDSAARLGPAPHGAGGLLLQDHIVGEKGSRSLSIASSKPFKEVGGRLCIQHNVRK
nr:hypothetical protein [Tanacetum cinerariifolium]